jgi:hypothetical protein
MSRKTGLVTIPTSVVSDRGAEEMTGYDFPKEPDTRLASKFQFRISMLLTQLRIVSSRRAEFKNERLPHVSYKRWEHQDNSSIYSFEPFQAHTIYRHFLSKALSFESQ